MSGLITPDVCDCPCHVHKIINHEEICCSPCQYCGKNIKKGYELTHKETCPE